MEGRKGGEGGSVRMEREGEMTRKGRKGKGGEGRLEIEEEKVREGRKEGKGGTRKERGRGLGNV